MHTDGSATTGHEREEKVQNQSQDEKTELGGAACGQGA